MATFMHPWSQQPSSVTQSMAHYMHDSIGHWNIPTSLAPQPHIPQHPGHGLSLLHQLTHPLPPLRAQTNSSPLAPQQSQAQRVPHSQPMPHSQQHIPPALSLPPPESLSLAHHQSQQYQQTLPHQVVGQQGIRGVLASASGDPPSPDDNCEPEQDAADGSWPCKCCGKRYRHAKHLRRHHSRHTGETPYECQLCKRRFGRSDVLKRHYHKCATRRGQPVGDHLAGQRGHPRRQRVKGQGLDINSIGHVDDGSPISNGPIDVKPPMTPVTRSTDGITPAFIG